MKFPEFKSITKMAHAVATHSAFNTLIWYGYLLLLCFISVVTKSIDSPAWLLIAAIVFAYAGVYALAAVCGARCHWQAFREARHLIMLLLVGIVWLGLQTILPSSHASLVSFLPLTLAPEWYSPDRVISITPLKTQWLLFSSLLVFAWFVLSMAVIDSRRRVKQLLMALLVIGCVHASVGILAMVSDLYLVDRTKLDGHFRVARAWFVNRNHYAAFLNLSLVGCFALLFRPRLERGKLLTSNLIDFLMSPRILFFAGALLIFGASIMSQSRGGLASVILAFIVVVGVGATLNQNFRKTLRRNIKFAIFVLILLLSLFLYFGQELLVRLNSESFSLGERVTQWQITWRAISDSWLVGYGGGSYGTVFQLYREFSDLRQVYFDQSHNDYLHIWLEQGLLGVLIWLAIIYLIIKRAVNSAVTTTSSLIRSTSLACLIVIGAALLQSGVDFNLQIINIRCYFFVIIALIYVLPSINKNH